ncbi:MAG: hypothetical protein HY866_17410 [Chloroflexi bacterium]|nr:hypothetical protein [Chloroflexota bacterium]
MSRRRTEQSSLGWKELHGNILNWNVGLGTTRYQVQIDNNTDFSSPTQDVIASELTDGVYVWCVRAINTMDAAGEWTSQYGFLPSNSP